MEDEDEVQQQQQDMVVAAEQQPAKRTSKAQKRREKKEAAKREAEAAPPDVFVDTSEEALASIMAMGFDEMAARQALRGGQTMERALESLLAQC